MNENANRWLLLTDAGFSTHATAGEAAAAWDESGIVFGQVIDLEAADIRVRYNPPRIVLGVAA